MREILFRGKIKDTVFWRQGYYFKNKNVEAIQHFIDGIDFYSEIDLKTLGQYTGLDDKNGNKIFEGDIVKVVYNVYKELREGIETSFEMIEQIVFEKGAFMLKVMIDDIPLYRLLYDKNYNGIIINSIEVIGNIYDNPELIEE